MILAAALLLRILGIMHGLPHNYVADTTVVRAALSLGAGANPFAGESLPTQYPYLLPYLLFVIFGSLYAGGKVLGLWTGIAEFESYAHTHPETFFLTARLVVALFGCFLVLLVALIAHRFWGRRAALASGAFAASSLLLVQLAQQERPHTVAAVWILASLFFATRSIDSSRLDLLLSWLGAALAGSTVPYGLLSLSIPMAAILTSRAGRLQKVGRFLVGVGIASAVIIFFYPKLVTGLGGAFAYEEARGGVVRYYEGLIVAPSLLNGRGFAKLATWSVLYEPVLVLCAVLGIGLALHRGAIDRRIWILASFPVLFTLIYGVYEVIHPRYVLPLVPFLCLPAGYWIGSLWDQIEENFSRPAARVALSAVLALLVFTPPLVQALRLDYLLRQPDSRDLALSWSTEELPREVRVGLEGNGVPLPPTTAALQRMATRVPAAIGVRDRRLLEQGTDGWDVERLWYTRRYKHNALKETEAFRPVRFVVAVRHTTDARGDAFYLSLQQDAELVHTISPARQEDTEFEARLPSEMLNPLTGLWRVERPGPILEIYRVFE